MKKKVLWGILCIFLILSFTPNLWADESENTYSIMHPDEETLLRWIDEYENAPRAYIDESLECNIPLSGGSLTLLSRLQYTPSQRNQSSCGNCWVWASTGVMGIALNVQEGISDRLSTQYLNSCNGTGSDYACCGGSPTQFETFYTGAGKAIPWSNTNASFQDQSGPCPGSSGVSCGSISTSPNYPISSISAQTITTQTVTHSQAIANIKNILHQNKGIYFSFRLANTADWNNFRNFWNNQGESVIWNPNFSCGHSWVSGQGGGHAVLCVGYNDDDPNNSYWIMLNSWGTPAGRPNGLFRLDMDMNYSCMYDYFGTNYYSFAWHTFDVQFDIAGQVIYVDPSGTCGGHTPCYTTIQAAINAAATGTTIKIVGGVYNEALILNSDKNLTLEGGYDSAFTSQSSQTIANSLTIYNGKITADHLVLQSGGTITTTTTPFTTTTTPTTTTTIPITTTTTPTTTTTIPITTTTTPTTTTTIPITTTTSSTTTTTPSGGSEVWICTEANCSTIRVTFGGVTPAAYLNCGTRMRFYNVPAGNYSYSAFGCGINWPGGSFYVNGTSSYTVWLCPPTGYPCCPSGCGTNGAFRCAQCGGGTTTTTIPITTTTSSTTTTTPSGGSEVWICTEANCSTIRVTFGGVTPAAYLSCGTRMRFYNVPAGNYSYSAFGCGINWPGGSFYVNGTSSYTVWFCPPSGYPCCHSGCGSGGAFRCAQCP